VKIVSEKNERKVLPEPQRGADLRF